MILILQSTKFQNKAFVTIQHLSLQIEIFEQLQTSLGAGFYKTTPMLRQIVCT